MCCLFIKKSTIQVRSISSPVRRPLPIWLWPLIRGVESHDGEKGENGWPGLSGDEGPRGEPGTGQGEKGDTGERGDDGERVSDTILQV